MRFHHRLLALAAILAAGVTCSFPTDQSDRVFVTVVSLDTSIVVQRGGKLELYARMYHAAGTDTIEIQNVRFAWTSDNEDVATVAAGVLGSAEVTGVNSGLVNINARAVAFENAQSAQFTARVSNPVEIDSVRPVQVRWGDTVTVYGVGVDSIILAFLADGLLIDYPVPDTQFVHRERDSLGFSRATFWVTPPARSSQLAYIGPGVFGTAPDSTRVIPGDRYEPNEEAPWLLDLTLPAALPAVPFLNLGLALEPFPREQATGEDWYRFTQGATGDLTFIVNVAGGGNWRVLFADSLEYGGPDVYALPPAGWAVGPGIHDCRGQLFRPAQFPRDSNVIALAGVPARGLHGLIRYTQFGVYSMAVVSGYVSSDAKFPRDAREEDDYCAAADAAGSVATVPAAAFRDTLTIDNPHDVDWIRFTVGGTVAQTVRFRTAALAAAQAQHDIDLYVLTVPGGGASSTLDLVGRADVTGSDEDLTLLLVPGAYYAVVVDFLGVPLAYSACIGAAIECGTAFPSPPAARSHRAAKPKGTLSP
ncbi:MAG: hypothetical protein ACREMJ_06840 [Gemmatimonadales bacterium]